jgi:hypothetical protein
MAKIHIIGPHEEAVQTVYNTTLSNRQFCVVLNPYNPFNNSNEYGKRELRKG